ncbi:MAG: ABC transporter ATP-binding protein [Propionibacteriaceae bacterium]|jgi:putative ABC transport system ATP-binding protein|nr:ABC transporter ATP-binding protein [Propionibacteriaceae bacterium]
MASPIVEFHNVVKRYQTGDVTVTAVDRVDLTVEEGEFAVILGASGAGKTTVLNLLGGMDAVTEGQILVAGQDITTLNDKDLTVFRRIGVGFVFQFYNLIANLTARENVEFAAARSPGRLDAAEVLAQVGLTDRLDHFPAQLSGGEQQRVAIARAVAKNPLLLLCDEPTGALDYETGRQVLELLTEVNRERGKTVVVITHNSALAAMADRVVKLRSGQVESVTLNPARRPVAELEW